MTSLNPSQRQTVDRLIGLAYRPMLDHKNTDGSVSVTIARKLAQGHMQVVVKANGDVGMPYVRDKSNTNARTHA